MSSTTTATPTPVKYDWIVLVPDYPNTIEKRLAARPAHLEGLQTRVENGDFKMGGATLHEPPVDGQTPKFNGSCVVAHASTKEEVIEELRKDIYVQSGVWDLDNAQIFPMMTAFRKEK